MKQVHIGNAEYVLAGNKEYSLAKAEVYPVWTICTPAEYLMASKKH